MSDRVTLTKATINQLKPPARGRVLVWDAKVRGLVLRVTETGAKSFYVYRKVNRRPKRYFICKWPDLPLAQIRTRAEQYNADIANGVDPTARRKEARECKTLGEVWEYYLEHHAKPHKKSWRFDNWQWNRFLTSWSGKLLTQISVEDVDRLHKKIGKETGEIPANRLRSLLHSLFAIAIEKLKFRGENPVEGVKPYKEPKRQRFLRADELSRLLAAFDDEPNQMLADFFRLALFSGARRGNLQSARWEEIDLDAGVWTIPAEKAKAGEAIPVPLSAEAIAVLKRRKAAAKSSPWVFPSFGQKGHLTEPKTAWKRICKVAKLDGVRLHDLRHTTASWMFANGASLYLVGKALGHQNQRTTERYAHLDVSHLRAALGVATGAMAAAAKKKGRKKEADRA